MILVVDNYDSFTYNLVQYLGVCGAEVVVRRNDAVTVDEVRSLGPRGVLLSPGPCRPTDSGVCLAFVSAALEPGSPIHGLPLFGVCLGHQAIGLASGGEVGGAKTVRHGKTSPIRHDGEGLFRGLPDPLSVVRYHSLSVGQVPPGFLVTARSLDDDEVMGLRHKSLPIEGVQFHPESVLTEHGLEIVRNFVAMCA